MSEQKPKGKVNTQVDNEVKDAKAEAEDRLATVKKVKNIHENAATNEQFQLTMGSTELDYDRNEFSTPQKVHSESIQTSYKVNQPRKRPAQYPFNDYNR